MKLYEGLFVFPPNVSEEDRKKQEKALESQVEKYGGAVKNRQVMGVRSLGYEIKKNREGYMVLWDVEFPTEKVAAFRRAVELNPDILKYMISVKVEIPRAETPKKEAPAKAGTEA